MSGMSPFFITGSNAKIKINGVTMAFITDLNVDVSIQHQQAKVCGLIEADTLEPVGYSIQGSFTLIRYLEGNVRQFNKQHKGSPNGANNLGNGIGSMIPDNLATQLTGFGVGNLPGALDPSKITQSTGFDIEVYQKVPRTFSDSTSRVLANRVSRFITGDVQGSADLSGVLRVRDCHITGVRTNLNKKNVMTQTFSFVANYIDEDSYVSSSSDNGQRIS
jgi:hypothetical protein